MEYIQHCSGKIWFHPRDGRAQTKRYSDRSTVEIRGDNNGRYALRALDVENKNQEIFNVLLRKSTRYIFGDSLSGFDKLDLDRGTYYLYLNDDQKKRFRDQLRSCFEELQLLDEEPDNIDSGGSQEKKRTEKAPARKSPSDIIKLHNMVNVLSEYIEKGDEDKAENVIKQLAEARTSLTRKTLQSQFGEGLLSIKIQIMTASSDLHDEGKSCEMMVYPSTKISELRTIFQYSHDFPVVDQYYFANSCLAHDESTMKDLKVNNGSSLILLYVDIPEKRSAKF